MTIRVTEYGLACTDGRLREALRAIGLDGPSRSMSNPPFTRPGTPEEERLETLLGRPLEVEVRDSVDKALKILKQKMSKEGILQEIKRRRYYEKPSVKRKRKMREARKRRRREAKRRVVR
jgi:small subunit ribosomal protein S21